MKDFTQGSLSRHIVGMAAPMAAGMVVQALYYLVDLYFVGRLGDAAIAGVSAGGTAAFIVMALTQMLGVGTVALMSHAVGRKDQADANLIFNQSLLLALALTVLTLAGGYAGVGAYMRTLGADQATRDAGATFLRWSMPGLALQFALVAMGSALRGTGIVKPTMIVQVATILINTALAPVLIAGWGTGRPMGVAGAGLATSISVAAGVLLLWAYFTRLEKYVAFHPEQWKPRLATWRRMLGIGFPAGGELGLLFVYMGVIYWVIRDFGAEAQAGFGIGGRVMQAFFLPAMAVAFSAAPIAGQNFGARQGARVRETFRSAALIGSGVMLTITLICQWKAEAFVQAFTTEAPVIAVGAGFLRIISWNFVGNGLVFTCSGIFQALGNTWPSLVSTGSRLLTFAVPAVWLSRQPGFRLEHVWYLSVATITLQVLTSLLLVRHEMRKRLGVPGVTPAGADASARASATPGTPAP